MNLSQFQDEDRKYSILWSSNYSSAKWKKLAKKLVQNEKRGKLIDLGFGNGESLNYFLKKGFDTYGVEISCLCVDNAIKKGFNVYHGSLDNLNFYPDSYFEFGFCNDVIEHLPEELIIDSLREIKRICSKKLYLSVCPTLSHHLSAKGENLHLTVKPKEWWESQFNEVGEVKHVKFAFSRSLRYVINFQQ